VGALERHVRRTHAGAQVTTWSLFELHIATRQGAARRAGWAGVVWQFTC
jgi:hypothetical protein